MLEIMILKWCNCVVCPAEGSEVFPVQCTDEIKFVKMQNILPPSHSFVTGIWSCLLVDQIREFSCTLIRDAEIPCGSGPAIDLDVVFTTGHTIPPTSWWEAFSLWRRMYCVIRTWYVILKCWYVKCEMYKSSASVICRNKTWVIFHHQAGSGPNLYPTTFQLVHIFALLCGWLALFDREWSALSIVSLNFW